MGRSGSLPFGCGFSTFFKIAPEAGRAEAPPEAGRAEAPPEAGRAEAGTWKNNPCRFQ